MPSTGEKAKLLTVVDDLLSEAPSLVPSHSIEIAIGKSPKRGNICGALTVFKSTQMDLDLQPSKDISIEEINQMQQKVAETTQVAFIGPEYWAEAVNQKGIRWAQDRALQLFDQFQDDAYITIVCAQLKIYERISRDRVRALRADPELLFETSKRIVRLLENSYTFDPWNHVIRRGHLGPRK